MSTFQFSEEAADFSGMTGYRAAGIHCDVRGKSDGRLDLALVVSECPCTVAGVFTRNKMAAAPVRLAREMLAGETFFKGFVVNSGNANACTGPEGMVDARAMREAVASELECDPEEIFVCSTGRIGERLPMDRILSGIKGAATGLVEGREGWARAADAILTSDTCRKMCSVRIETDSGPVTMVGFAKGAGMIEPNMATMLAFICTDAAIDSEEIGELLKASADSTFNAITVDGDESTNDSVLLLANGSSGACIARGTPEWDDFKEALQAVCQYLAAKIVGDGEKITKVVEISIEGAATREDAGLAARAVANSLLVKSSWYGNDPNWGRIMDALGYSGAALSEDTVRLWYAGATGADHVAVFDRGTVLLDNRARWKAIVSGKRFRIIADLGQGAESTRVWSTDLTEGYVNFNKSE